MRAGVWPDRTVWPAFSGSPEVPWPDVSGRGAVRWGRSLVVESGADNIRRTTMRCLSSILVLAILIHLPAADDPAAGAYTALGHGRISDALPSLFLEAQRSGRWYRWYDAGRAALEDGHRGYATAWLLEAHRRAPGATAPLIALRHLHPDFPRTWTERLGPLAIVGGGWCGLVLVLLGGAGLGYAALGKRFQRTSAISGLVMLVLVLPAAIARHHDASTDLVAVTVDTCLFEATGKPRQPVAAGTLAHLEPQAVWNGRLRLRLLDGESGWVPLNDLEYKLRSSP